MITVYNSLKKLEIYQGSEVEDIYGKITKKCWVHLTNPTEEEILNIVRITNIDEDVIRKALDEEESAHFDIDEDVTLTVVDLPIVEVDDEYPSIHKYITVPFGFIFNNDYFITLCLKDNVLEQMLSNRWMRTFSTKDHMKLMIQLLYSNSARFVNILKILNKDSELIQKHLHESMKNKQLYELMKIGKSLVFLSTGLNANYLVLDRIKRLDVVKNTPDNNDLIEDAIIENRQAFEMCSIHREILNNTMDGLSSIISNNVNSIMKTLTDVTIILAIPTLVASFFGMNFDLPFKENGFLIAFLIALALATTGAIILVRYTNGIKKNKNK